MSQHLALILPEKFGKWEVGPRPTPKPGKGEVLIKVSSTALNPVDAKIQKAGIFVTHYPAVVGCDCSGVIEEVGEDVTSFVKGDRVLWEGELSPNSEMGSHQQYTIGLADIVAKIPSSMSFDQAATIPLGLATASVGLYLPLGDAVLKNFFPDGNAGLGLTPPWTPEGKDKYKDKAIVILGGSSSVGQYAIQLAKLSGFSPIITTSSSTHEAFLKEIGATHVVNRSGDQVVEIKKLLPNGETDLVFDAISSADTEKLAVAVSSPKASIGLVALADRGVDFGERFVTPTFGSVRLQRKFGVSLYKELPRLLESGAIKPNRPEVIPGGLIGIVAGLERVANNQVSGVKLVGHPWE